MRCRPSEVGKAARDRKSRGSWSIPEVLRHDASLIQSLSNELARYEKALRYMADYQMTGTEMTLHIDFQGKAREALRRV